jgi:aromatic amino acid aminotransferase I
MAPPSAIDIRGLTDTEAVIYPDPLTVKEVAERRAKAGKLIAGVAAGTSSDLFKSKVRATSPSDHHQFTRLTVHTRVMANPPSDSIVSQPTCDEQTNMPEPR